MKQVIRTAKTGVLIVLVVLSVVLSYLLWSGNLKEGSEIGFVQTSPMPTATTPDLAHAVRPYRIVVNTPQGTTVVNPGSGMYASWTNWLKGVHVLGESPVKELPAKLDFEATFEFGVDLTHTTAAQWLKPFSSLIGNWSGRNIILYKLPGDSLCHVGFVENNEILTMKTDMDAASLLTKANQEVQSAPYDVIGDSGGTSYIPRDLAMNQYIYNIRQPDLLPLVHTFFVNLQAVSHIQQDANTSLWTDGSRAVLWDKQTQLLQYEDPNGEEVPLHEDDFLTALEFIHTHGGGAQNVIGFDQFSSLTLDSSVPAYTFTQYVDGFPILSNASDYNVNMENGRVLEYDRPMWVLEQPATKTSVHVIDQEQLEAKLKKIDPTAPLDTFSMVLGYASESTAALSAQNEVLLQPVYYVTNGSGNVWMVDATNGSIVLGSDQS